MTKGLSRRTYSLFSLTSETNIRKLFLLSSNSFREEKKRNREEKERELVVACLVAEIDLTRCLDLTAINYEDGCKGKLTWPFPCYNDKGKCVLPNGKLIAKNKILKRKKWDAYTETIDSDYLTKMGIDTIMFRIDDTIEIAVYNIDRILNVREVPLA